MHAVESSFYIYVINFTLVYFPNVFSFSISLPMLFMLPYIKCYVRLCHFKVRKKFHAAFSGNYEKSSADIIYDRRSHHESTLFEDIYPRLCSLCHSENGGLFFEDDPR